MPWRKKEQNLGLGLTRKTVKPSSENANEQDGAERKEDDSKPHEQVKQSE